MKKIYRLILAGFLALCGGGMVAAASLSSHEALLTEAATEDVELAKLTTANIYNNRSTGTYQNFTWGISAGDKVLEYPTPTSISVPTLYNGEFYVSWNGAGAAYTPKKASVSCTITGDGVGDGVKVLFTRGLNYNPNISYPGMGYSKSFDISKGDLQTWLTGSYDFQIDTYIATNYTINDLNITIWGERTYYTVSITKGTGIESVYLSTNQNATSGDASGAAYDNSTKVYGFAVLKEGYRVSNSSWVLVSGTKDAAGSIYRIGQKTLNGSNQNFGTVNALAKQKIINMNLEGGSGYQSLILTYGQAINSIGTPTRPGYAFLGWNSKADGTGTDYGNSMDVNTVNSIVLGTLTDIYAQWERTGTLITLDKQGGTGGSNEAIGIKDAVLADIEIPTKAGYEFGGYFSEENGQGTQYYGADGKSEFTWTSDDETATFYAKWTMKTVVEEAIDKIDDIGTVSYPDSGEAISTARNAYDSVPADDQSAVSNYNLLVDAESAYSTLRQQGVDDAEALISAIGEVTLDKEDGIVAARSAYDGLTEEQKNMIDENALPTLVAAEERLAELKGNKAAADAVVAKIDEIGTVSYPDSGEAISAARDAYDALTNNEQRSFVTNYDALVDAEQAYEDQKVDGANTAKSLIEAIGTVEDSEECKGKIEAARNAYDALTEEQKALVGPEAKAALEEAEAEYKSLHDQNQADAVEALISAAEHVECSPEFKAKMEAAREAYDSLSDDQKELVENYSILTQVETVYGHIDQAVTKIDDIGTVTYSAESYEKIEAARNAYDALTEEEKGLLPDAKLEDLTNAEAEYARLQAEAATMLGWAIALIVIGSLILLCGACYLVMFFFLNKWIRVGDKAARVFKFGKKEDKVRLIAMPFKFVYLPEEEVFSSKEEALK